MQRVGDRVDQHAESAGPSTQQRVFLHQVPQHANAGDFQAIVWVVRQGDQLTDQKFGEILGRYLDPLANESETLFLVVVEHC